MADIFAGKPTDGAQGADVSLWQDDNSTPQRVDFKKMKAKGVEFVYIKSSQALYLDPDYIWNWKAAADAGLLRGAYHYHVWHLPARDQAAFMWGALQQDPGELPLMMDLEHRTTTRPSAPIALLDVWNFLTSLEGWSHRVPGLYFSPSYWFEFGTVAHDPKWARFPLWLAHYRTKTPWIPKPWTTYTFWQYNDLGLGLELGAESKELDVNVFNGSVAELHAYAGQQPPPPAQTVPLATWAQQVHGYLVKQGYQGPAPEA